MAPQHQCDAPHRELPPVGLAHPPRVVAAGDRLDADALLQQVRRLESQVTDLAQLLKRREEALLAIHQSTGWMLLTWLYGVRNRLFPAGSSRARFVRLCVRSLAAIWRRMPRFRWRRQKVSRPREATPQDDAYAIWIRENEPAAEPISTDSDSPPFKGGVGGGLFALAGMHDKAGGKDAPLFSILVPGLQQSGAHTARLLNSLREQVQGRWEVCLADDASGMFKSHAGIELAADARVGLVSVPPGASLASRMEALRKRASGNWAMFLDSCDSLAPFALRELMSAAERDPTAGIVYADEDCIDDNGRRRDPWFKPDWSPDSLRSHNYLGRSWMLSRRLMDEIGPLDELAPGAELYDLALRASERAGSIVHVTKVLVHAGNSRQFRDEAIEATFTTGSIQALSDHLDRQSVPGRVLAGLRPGTFQVQYAHPAGPLVSIIIPNKDQSDVLARCVESVRRSSHGAWEILIAENNSQRDETWTCYDRLVDQGNVRILTWTKPFNYAAINNFAVESAQGDVLVFLNNDVEVISPDWLERMLDHALRPTVGAVGAKLYFPDGTIQHGGVIVGLFDGVGHAFRQCDGKSAGYGNRLVVTQNMSAVTGACMMTRRKVFAELGGFDEAFVVTFNDIDLCLRMREAGYLVVWTPHAELFHFECKTRGYDRTVAQVNRAMRENWLFESRWPGFAGARDPYYSPHLTCQAEDFSLRLKAGPGAAANREAA